MTSNEIKLDQKATNYLKDKLGGGEGGTTVVANPTLSGDEDNLTGLQVGETKYAVGGGKQLYQHTINLVDNTTPKGVIAFTIINASNEKFTINTLKNYLETNYTIDFQDNLVYLPCNGVATLGGGTYPTIIGIGYLNDGESTGLATIEITSSGYSENDYVLEDFTILETIIEL